MRPSGRNRAPLTPVQIDYCQLAWAIVCGNEAVELDVSEASRYGTRTRFSEDQEKVLLGADSSPGDGSDANSRLSTLACLAHEFAHAERYRLGYRRPVEMPDALVDEAETSLRACFI